ncbi:MAG: ribonuclease HII [Candidatus Aenigmatarchaeota archaeon]
MTGFIAGVDEAGRGAVIGPLVIAAVSLEPEKEAFLKKQGVRDSKLVTPKKRKQLAELIEKHAKDIIVINVESCRIDSYRNDGINLNQIETMKFIDALSYLTAHTAYVDCPDVNPDRMKKILQNKLGKDIKLVVEHKADHNYPVCSAASIIAKEAREEALVKLKKEYGDFGPGYSSNDITIQWMKDWIAKNKEYPDIVRKTWMTSETIKNNKLQKDLGSWFKGIVKK